MSVPSVLAVIICVMFYKSGQHTSCPEVKLCLYLRYKDP